MNFFKFLVMFGLFAGISGVNQMYAQSISLDSMTASPGDTIYVSMSVENLLNVGAFSLYIAYDESVLEYLSIENLIAEANGTLANTLQQDTNTVVGLSWLAPGATGIDFPDGEFLDIRFRYIGGVTDLLFTGNCEVVDWDATLINVTYLNGEVSPLTGITTEKQPEFIFGYSGNTISIFPANFSGEMTLLVADLSGRILYKKDVMLKQDKNEFIIPVNNQLCIVQLYNENLSFSRKILIQSF